MPLSVVVDGPQDYGFSNLLCVPHVGCDQAIDPDYYKSLCQMLECSLEDLGLDLTFSAEVDEFGRLEVHDLVPNGRNIQVTDENKMEYIKLMTHFRM